VAGVQGQPNVLFQSYINGQLIRTLMDRKFEAHGASNDDFGLLSAIGIWSPVTPTELAARVGLRPTTLSSALRRLETRGHLRRLPHPSDGRSHLIQLTETGDRVWKDGWPALREAIGEVERELGPEYEGILERMRRLEQALRAALAAPVDDPAISQ
jgi:DNA-binding MarR family transcriptional regulator